MPLPAAPTTSGDGASGQGHSPRSGMAKHRSWFSPRVQHGLAKPSRGQARRNGRNLTLPLSELVFVLGSPRARAAPTSLCHTGPAPRDGGTGSVALELGLWPGSDACERRARALFWGPGVKDRFGFSAKHPMQGQGSPVGNGARSRGLCATVFALPSCLGLEMQSSWGQQRERWGTESTSAPRHRSRAPRQHWGARTVTPVLACVPHRSLTSPLPQNVGTHWMSPHPPCLGHGCQPHSTWLRGSSVQAGARRDAPAAAASVGGRCPLARSRQAFSSPAQEKKKKPTKRRL